MKQEQSETKYPIEKFDNQGHLIYKKYSNGDWIRYDNKGNVIEEREK